MLDAAVILAGGGGRRLGGADKPALIVAGRSLLDIALRAVGECPVVVVGPERPVPAGVVITREQPPGGGPAAGIVAGLQALRALPDRSLIAVLAADLPGIDAQTVKRLTGALTAAVGVSTAPDGAVLIDDSGRRQLLIGVWRGCALVTAAGFRSSWHGRSVRELLSPIPMLEVPAVDRETADIDTPEDWLRWRT